MTIDGASPRSVPARSRPSIVRSGEHACCQVASAGDRDRLAAAFIADGLARRHKVLSLRDARAGEPGLRRAGLDEQFHTALLDGRLVVGPGQAVLVPDGAFGFERLLCWARRQHALALAEGWAGLSATAEMSALDGEPGWERLTGDEAPPDAEPRATSMRLLCQYDVRRLAGAIPEVEGRHLVEISSLLAGIGRTARLEAAVVRPEGTLRLAGDLDFQAAPTVSDILHAHFHGPLRLDLADLRFVDVVGLRALRGRPGQELTIEGAPSEVLRLLELVAWDTDPAVRIVPAPGSTLLTRP